MSSSSRVLLRDPVVSTFGQLFRMIPNGPLKFKLKKRVFDKYLGWRTLDTSARTKFGAKMRVRFPDMIQSTIFLTGLWEPAITRLLTDALAPGDIFVDVGANVGYYSLLASTIVGSRGKAYAIEASPRIYSRLRANLEWNNALNVEALHYAVSNAKGQCEIYMGNETNLGHSSIIANVAKDDGQALEAIVATDTLQNLVGESNLLSARFIKIDIEGAERLAIEGLGHLLGEFSERTEWLIELSPKFSPNGQSDVDWIFDSFRRKGYSAFLVENNYSDEHLYDSPPNLLLQAIDSAPTVGLSDVVFSRVRR